MADTSTIEWTDATWNVVTGCTKVSPGCDHCYAETFSERFRGTAGHHFENGFDLTLRPERLTMPLRWRKPKRVFVNSMSDLFHKDIPSDYIARAFAVMALTPQHTYQVLTKRHGRMRSLLGACSCGSGHAPGVHFRSAMAWAVSKANPDRIPGVPDDAEQRVYHETAWPLPNVWLGVSVEDQKWADIRIPALLDTPAAVRFLSCEPLLGPVRLVHQDHSGHERDYDGDFICLDCSTDEKHVPWRTVDNPALDIDWVIIGGESGPGARPFDPQWAADLITDAREVGAAPFVKQLGSVWARDFTVNGKSVAAHGDTKGGKPEHWPAELRVREYPATVHARRYQEAEETCA